ncbi:type III secretion system inner membrane ring subunit SctD [Pandoraea sputorum]|uniref:EscD/YscD/HrpQ family type III secretion system inner membrane ring protein n=1 Tax=Pandoraea sputorum TaxID=93222 RepID=A0A5E5BKN4_9BURK|nr:type III secretion system inner membrane ring subunit SctD [Pandoraea sputorum]VVE85672.1 EscD/YscD/HrpQ family type III secretion system inner membrane ring protein [Pandoraea sputorum]
MEAAFKLKLLRGPLAGHELRLPAGPFSVGGDESDLALPLEGGGTATLEVSEAGVALTSATPCWVNGRRCAPGALPPRQVIDLAGVALVWGPADAELGHPSVPPRGPAYGGVLALLVTTLALAGALGWSLLPAPVTAPPSARDWLPQALLSEPGLTARWLGEHTLELSGRCRDSAQLQTLTTRLRAAGVHLRTETVCQDELRQAVRSLMASFGDPDARVTIDAAGRAEIDGPIVNDGAALVDALDKLPGLTGWQLTDRGGDELAALLPRLQAAGLLSGLSATRAERGWLFSGQLEAGQQARLQAFLARASAEPGRLVPLRFVGATRDSARADDLPAAIAGVGGNTKAPYVQLSNGLRLVVGSTVAHGLQVIAIGANGISLAGRRELVFLPLHH